MKTIDNTTKGNGSSVDAPNPGAFIGGIACVKQNAPIVSRADSGKLEPVVDWHLPTKIDGAFRVLLMAKKIEGFAAMEDVEKCLGALYHIEELWHEDQGKAADAARAANERWLMRWDRIAKELDGLMLTGTPLLQAVSEIFDIQDASREALDIQIAVETLEL